MLQNRIYRGEIVHKGWRAWLVFIAYDDLILAELVGVRLSRSLARLDHSRSLTILQDLRFGGGNYKIDLSRDLE
jgi:hypothetical protein